MPNIKELDKELERLIVLFHKIIGLARDGKIDPLSVEENLSELLRDKL
jgi:hypothetical protein